MVVVFFTRFLKTDDCSFPTDKGADSGDRIARGGDRQPRAARSYSLQEHLRPVHVGATVWPELWHLVPRARQNYHR